MAVLTYQDQLRQSRIDSLTEEVGNLISGRGQSTTFGMENLSAKIKHHNGILVELRDEQISKLVVLLNELFTTYVKDETSRGGEAARLALAATAKNYEFTDKVSYLDDPEKIALLRRPVIRSYFSCFRNLATVKDPTTENFGNCLDLMRMREDLDRSEYVLKLPMFFTMKDNVLQFDRLNDLLVTISDSLTIQNEKICRLLEAIVRQLSRGELIANADILDLSLSKFTSMGVTVEPVVVNEVNQMWYKNNLSTSIEGMVDNLKQTLTEPHKVIARTEETTEGGFLTAMKMMSSDAFVENVRIAQLTAKGITGKIEVISDQMLRFSQRIQLIPARETDGYYNTAIEDIARLISLYSGVLSICLEFVLDYVEGLKEGVDNVELLSSNLQTHQIEVSKYVSLRKEKKWL